MDSCELRFTVTLVLGEELIAAFKYEEDATEFASNVEYERG